MNTVGDQKSVACFLSTITAFDTCTCTCIQMIYMYITKGNSHMKEQIRIPYKGREVAFSIRPLAKRGGYSHPPFGNPDLSWAKTDTEFFHQLSTTEVSLRVWNYVIMRSVNAQLVLQWWNLASGKAIHCTTWKELLSLCKKNSCKSNALHKSASVTFSRSLARNWSQKWSYMYLPRLLICRTVIISVLQRLRLLSGCSSFVIINPSPVTDKRCCSIQEKLFIQQFCFLL